MAMRSRLAFIGGGNMAEAILGGLLATGYPLSQCVVSEPMQARCEFLHNKYPGLQVLSGPSANQLAVNGSASPASIATMISEGAVHINPTAASSHSDFSAAEVVILAVKPQVLRSVVEDLGSVLRTKKPLVISIAAGIETGAIARAAGLYATSDATPAQRDVAESLMAAVSKQVSWVERESLIDTVTGISGSGPAYFFLMMEAMEDAGVALGMDRETAKALTIQTCLGAAKMAQTSEDDLKTLRVKVTSPHGTTDAAIKTFEAGGFRELVAKSVGAADARSRELALELGGKDLSNKL
ncbi:hypothetical protein BGZ81_010595 [Podila clonocystis]|nr:hypothetical protein BGZ81_010595 [Podila clonocystis]